MTFLRVHAGEARKAFRLSLLAGKDGQGNFFRPDRHIRIRFPIYVNFSVKKEVRRDRDGRPLHGDVFPEPSLPVDELRIRRLENDRYRKIRQPVEKYKISAHMSRLLPAQHGLPGLPGCLREDRFGLRNRVPARCDLDRNVGLPVGGLHVELPCVGGPAVVLPHEVPVPHGVVQGRGRGGGCGKEVGRKKNKERRAHRSVREVHFSEDAAV